MSLPFGIPLSMGFLFLFVGFVAIYRGRNLAEGQKVGGLGTYYDRTGFYIRGIMAIAAGIFLLILAIAVALST